MSHPHKKSVSPSHSASKVLFMPSHGGLASLVESVKKKQRAKAMTFSDPHTALTWCIENGAGFVYFQTENPLRN
jgi:saccharopine dehydrogenase-like NADP-dependent oxidoreductase